MKTVSRGCLAVVAAVAVSMLAQCARTHDAETKITIYPGMEILQGSTVCKVSFVETRLTLAIRCGSIGSIRIGPFVVDKAGIDKRDIGASLDSMTGGDQAVISGLVETIRGAALAAESWHAVMQQVVTDARVSGVRQPVHLISHRVNRKSGR